MIDSQTQGLLQDIFRRESSAFLIYIGDAFPWTTARGVPALERLNRIIGAERDAITVLGRYLARRRVPLPFHGMYPMSFTSFNFLSLYHLVPRLIQSQERLLAELDRDLPLITDADARRSLRNWLT